MRIWDLPVKVLCRQHLLGEHRELHAIWSILVNNKQGYRKHPEVVRWENCLPVLFWRHDYQVEEMLRRGYNHRSTLPWLDVFDTRESPYEHFQFIRINTIEEQIELLRTKGCACEVNSAVDRLAAIGGRT